MITLNVYHIIELYEYEELIVIVSTILTLSIMLYTIQIILDFYNIPLFRLMVSQ